MKRVAPGDLQFQVVTIPNAEEQLIRIRDVAPQANNWRSGFNLNPIGLDGKAVNQIQLELDNPNVCMKQGTGVTTPGATDKLPERYIAAERPLRDGTVVASLGGLVFDSLSMLRAFINGNDHARYFLGGLVRIDNVKLA